MPRTQRWQQVSHSFQSGVLSPAAQDQVDGPAWLSGAADVVNFEVMRDGGLAGRPPFVRSPHVFTAPGWSAIKLDGDDTDINRDAEVGHLSRHDNLGADTAGGDPLIGLDGVHALRRRGHVTNVGTNQAPQVEVDKAIYEVELDSPVKAVTWHDVRLVDGEWRTTIQHRDPDSGRQSPRQRLNFQCQYLPKGEDPTDASKWMTRDPVSAQVSTAAGDEDPFEWGVFAPGRVGRDVVVPLIAQAGSEAIAVDRVRIRAKRVDQSLPALTVGGVSAFTTDGTHQRKVWYERPPYRIVSWVAGSIPQVLVLTLEGVQVFHVDGSVVRTQAGPQRATWYFSPKQLRELTWIAYGKGILLFHKDFPYPLRVQPGHESQLVIRYLPLVNIPTVADLRRVPDAAVSTYERVVVQLPEAQYAQAVGGGATGQQMQQRITGYLPPPAARSDGPAAGREIVPADVSPIRPRPVVVRRDLFVEQLRNDPSAPVQLPVTPELVPPPRSFRAGQILVRWDNTGARDYKIYYRTVASYNAAPSDDRWSGVMPVDVADVTDPTGFHTLTGLTSGERYYIGMSSVVNEVESAISIPISPVLVLYPAPPAPSNIQAVAIANQQGGVTITWDAVPGAREYHLQRLDPVDNVWLSVQGSPTTTTRLVTNFIRPGAWHVRIRTTRDNAAPGAWSAPVRVVLPDLRPAAPTGLSATATPSGFNAIWDRVADAIQYFVSWRQLGTQEWRAAPIVDQGLGYPDHAFTRAVSVAATYEVRVAVEVGALVSEWSDEVRVVVTLEAPPPTPQLNLMTFLSGEQAWFGPGGSHPRTWTFDVFVIFRPVDNAVIYDYQLLREDTGDRPQYSGTVTLAQTGSGGAGLRTFKIGNRDLAQGAGNTGFETWTIRMRGRAPGYLTAPWQRTDLFDA